MRRVQARLVDATSFTSERGDRVLRLVFTGEDGRTYHHNVAHGLAYGRDWLKRLRRNLRGRRLTLHLKPGWYGFDIVDTAPPEPQRRTIVLHAGHALVRLGRWLERKGERT